MDYNGLRKKYRSAEESRRQEESAAEVHRTSVQTWQRTDSVSHRVYLEELPGNPTPQEQVFVQTAGEKQVAVRSEQTSRQQNTQVTQNDGDVGGFFGGGDGSVRRTTTRSRQPWPGGRNLLNRLSALPWVDIVMILLTIGGIIWVIVNFDDVTLGIAYVAAVILESVIGILLFAAVIVGLVLLFSRRRFRGFF